VKINLIYTDACDWTLRRFSLKGQGVAAIKTQSQSRGSCRYKVLGAAESFFVAASLFPIDSSGGCEYIYIVVSSWGGYYI
jgi:hypothetical protein